MKKAMALFLTLLLLMSMVGTVSAASEPIKIAYWHTRGSGANYDTCKASVDLFNETVGKEKGIIVEEVFVGNYEDIFTKIQLAIQAGEQPQVAVMANTYVGYYIEDEVIADMMPFAERDGFDVNNFLDPFLQTVGNTDGELHSVPYIRSTPMLYYNKTMADAKGLTPSSKIDEMIEFCKGMTEVSATGETIYGLEILNDFGYYNAANIYQLGSELIAEDGKSAPCLDDGVMLKVLSDWRQWVDEGWCRSFDATDAAPAMMELFFQGKLGAFLNSSGSLKNVLTKCGEAGIEVGLLPYITYGEPLAEIGGANIGIIAEGNTDEQIEASWEFIKFLCSDEMVAQNAIGSGYLPITKSCGEYKTMTDFWAENPLYKVAYDQLAVSRCQEVPHVAFKQDFIRACWDACSMLIQDRSITPEQAVQQIKDTTASFFQ